MMQVVIVLIIFCFALAYLVWRFYITFFGGSGQCASGCSGCSTLDIDKIEKEIRKNEAKKFLLSDRPSPAN